MSAVFVLFLLYNPSFGNDVLNNCITLAWQVPKIGTLAEVDDLRD
jgi:hypothetical protein